MYMSEIEMFRRYRAAQATTYHAFKVTAKQGYLSDTGKFIKQEQDVFYLVLSVPTIAVLDTVRDVLGIRWNRSIDLSLHPITKAPTTVEDARRKLTAWRTKDALRRDVPEYVAPLNNTSPFINVDRAKQSPAWDYFDHMRMRHRQQIGRKVKAAQKQSSITESQSHTLEH